MFGNSARTVYFYEHTSIVFSQHRYIIDPLVTCLGALLVFNKQLESAFRNAIREQRWGSGGTARNLEELDKAVMGLWREATTLHNLALEFRLYLR